MLITEIVRPPLQAKSIQTPKFDPDKMPTRFKKVGFGIGSGITSSRVYKDLKHPNRVLKVVTISGLDDSYLRYVRMIEHHQDNPFFPKIYGYKVYEDQREDGYWQYKLYVFMETLYPMKYLPLSKVREIFAKLGISDVNKAITQTSSSYELRSQFNEPESRRVLKTNTQLPQFKQAMRLLEPMIRRMGSDLHIENFMLRHTPTQLQIVIVDPLWPSNLN